MMSARRRVRFRSPAGEIAVTNFRLLKRTRQTTEYSCGASALQSVLAWWGEDVDERELMRLMGTSEEEGT
jgi:predicted double-glycine peptidase